MFVSHSDELVIVAPLRVVYCRKLGMVVTKLHMTEGR